MESMYIKNIKFCKHDFKLVFLNITESIVYISNNFCNTLNLNTILDSLTFIV
jgi:hypothetical protein